MQNKNGLSLKQQSKSNNHDVSKKIINCNENVYLPEKGRYTVKRQKRNRIQ